ncbi:SusD/RagB family nutrient-binding outer membrane lipoprotein [Chitinophaga sp. sic0106]|uniref:SusD/RagB family nutrient-binding outer membrane lipoprotein n=1 Tax=Chitinophaga sp. sic0106 TaxID=2854785 RepID=UPI001C478316|nr:SusD/RagB family nutrient-binding outer membrane lipoprotein [Chitinophaga sp. sic0106]MBV7532221.1 SusD/RagB family nutrient-binding outer membrane lipoprotein [Chitinophaga sp. sic0106]
MKAIISKYLLGAALVTGLWGCEKMGTLQKDPSAVYDGNPKLVFTGILLNMKDGPWNDMQRHNQYATQNNSYYYGQPYDWTTSGEGFSAYDRLRDVRQLLLEAAKYGEVAKGYVPLARFVKAWFLIRATEMYGDIPMTDAIKGVTEGNFTPKYDEQKEVYRYCLQLLDSVNTELTPLVAGNIKVEGDFYYKGDLAKWQKLVNSFRLRVLMSLSKRADDNADLKIKEQFAEIVSNPGKYPLILGNADNFQLVYNGNSRDNNYPLWPADGIVIKRDNDNNLASTIVDILKRTADPRLFVMALPTDSAKKSGDAAYATKFTSFRGGSVGMIQSDLKALATAGKLSNLNFDFWEVTPSGVPCIQLGAAEINLTIAEAINRGWVSGDANAYYTAGIRANMAFYNVATAAQDVFLGGGEIVYAGNTAAGLRQILEQRYVAFFQNSGRQAFYQNRRTGVPVFEVGPANKNSQMIPVRWKYPSSEYNANESSLKAALQRQYGGSDTQNDRMWLVK